jgi:predicted MFS family arabinose efflux permease
MCVMPPHWKPVCLMRRQPSQFGFVATVFTIGGLFGSLCGQAATHRFGRIGVLRIAEIGFMIGAVMVGVANAIYVMIIGR